MWTSCKAASNIIAAGIDLHVANQSTKTQRCSLTRRKVVTLTAVEIAVLTVVNSAGGEVAGADIGDPRPPDVELPSIGAGKLERSVGTMASPSFSDRVDLSCREQERWRFGILKIDQLSGLRRVS